MLNAFLPLTRLNINLSTCVLIAAMSFSLPVFGQLDGAYSDSDEAHIYFFTEDGLYQVYEVESDDLLTSGSYTLKYGTLRMYDENDRLALTANLTKTRTGITLSAQGESQRLRYLCDAEDFLTLALLGALGSLIDK
ncbi:MAG: hypothetical protein ABMA02_00995 [Saprospiraceae bacterium]